MDIHSLSRELGKSARISYSDEWWLFPAVLVVAIGYPLWVGASGAAVTTIAEFVGLSLAVDPWTGRTTAIAIVLGMFWVVAPAAVATQIVLNRLRNSHGNLRPCYRLRRPLALFGLPVILLVVALVTLATVGTGSLLGQIVLVVGSLLVAIRGTAYAYRVFALSLPLLAEAILFLAVSGLSVTILAAGALGAGRRDLVADTAAGIAGVVNVPALANYADGVVAVGSVEISIVAATVVVPAVLPVGAYVAIQLAVSAIQRFRKPDVKRSSLRTGQRYPGFAHPTVGSGGRASGTVERGQPAAGGNPTGTSDGRRGGGVTAGSADGAADPITGPGSSTGDGTGGASGEAAAAGSAAEDADAGTGGADDRGADDVDDDVPPGVRHTRVYSPPEDADDIEMADEAEAARRTASGKFCPSCGDSYEGETQTFCPTCGARLEEP
jgi:hypothetical protein